MKNKDNKQIDEELVRAIYRDTRTVDLFDEFEKHNGSSPYYKRIVIQNCKYKYYGDNELIGYNLVIERGTLKRHVGDITITEFKQGNDADLWRHIAKEVSNEIIVAYKDTDQFYRFKEPYHLRAQSSRNRTGYGWTWDWSGGYGDYTEGTYYGETTDYVFAGVYITSGYIGYVRNKRIPFVGISKPE